MGRHAYFQPPRRTALLGQPGYRPIRLRVGALAQSSSGNMSPRNLTVAGGGGSSYGTWESGTTGVTTYALGDVKIAPDGQQWVCHTAHTKGATFSGPTHWHQLRPYAYFAAIWAEVFKTTTTAQDVHDRLRAANPACKIFQYVNVDTAYTSTTQQGINLYTWLDANKGWTYTSEPGTNVAPDTRLVPVAVGVGGQCSVNFARTNIVDSNGDNYHNYLAKQRASNGQYATMKFDGWACDNSLSMIDFGPVTTPDWDTNTGDYVTGSYYGGTNFWGTGYWRAGVSEASNSANVKAEIHKGFIEFWNALRNRNPGTRVMANGGIKMPAAWAGGVAFDSMLFEGWGNSTTPEQQDTNGWTQGVLANYRIATQFAAWKVLPALWGCQEYGCSSGTTTVQSQLPGGLHQDMRYWLATVLLTDSWFAWSQLTQLSSFRESAYRLYIKEYDAELGVPTASIPKAPDAAGVWSREYQNGIVIVHPRLTKNGWEGTANKTFTLPFACRRLTDTLDPADDGSLLPAGSVVSLPVRSGLILLKA